ncbi:MAG: hypothetical protein E7370_05760 [Clostridiales bacterium]|nr:hypothetical protein [Clostridiales bacterium]
MPKYSEEIQKALNEIKRALYEKSVRSLWQLGRAIGCCNRPTDTKKDALVDSIMAIAENRAEPVTPSKRGAPVKSKEYDKELADKILYFRSVIKGEIENYPPNIIEVNQNSAHIASEEGVISGVLQSTDSGWYLRVDKCYITPERDACIPSEMVTEFDLRCGDNISVKATKNKNGLGFTAVSLVSVNGVRPDMLIKRANFNSFIPCYGKNYYKLSLAENNLTNRVIDLFTPIALGARALVVGPSKSGKSSFLKEMAKAIKKADANNQVIFVSIAERPEEITEAIQELKGIEVAYSTFDTAEQNHLNTAILAGERAKRLVEAGKDTVLILDSLTKVVKACNARLNEKSFPVGEFSPNAFLCAKKIFGSARHVNNGASLTIIASVEAHSGSVADEYIYSQFKDGANTEIVLNKALSQNKLFPAIDIKASGTRREELLLSGEEIALSSKLKNLLDEGKAYAQIYELFNKTQSNAELLASSQKLIGEIK